MIVTSVQGLTFREGQFFLTVVYHRSISQNPGIQGLITGLFPADYEILKVGKIRNEKFLVWR